MKIQHNLSSLSTYGRLVSSASKAEKALEEISSGYRINRSADDAAGLAVSEKLRSQIRGLKQAIRNCQDGANLAQTFEGALDETELIVQRCKQLAAESANENYDDEIDRAAIEQEYKQLCKEVNNISDTDFNGIVMLNGGRLASVEKSGFGWIDPIELDWEVDSFENNTDDEKFSMKITKLPALDNYTLVDAEEYNALREFDQSEISVELVDGVAEFSFSNQPAPEKLSIVSKNNIGTVMLETSTGVVEIARVTVPEATIDINSIGLGAWSTTYGTFDFKIPTVTEIDEDGNSHTYDLSKVTDTTGNLSGSGTNKRERELYDQWNLTYNRIANNIRCVVSDNLEEFTITGSMASMVKDHQEGDTYKNGAKIILKTEPEYTEVTVSWNKESVYPGAAFYGSASYSDLTVRSSLTGTSELHGEYWRTPSVTLSVGSISSGTPANGNYTISSAPGTNRGYFLDHGNSQFTFTYTPPANSSSSGTWNLSITRHDDNGKPGSLNTSDSATIKYYSDLFGLTSGFNSVQTKIDNAHKQGFFTPDNKYLSNGEVYVDGNVPLSPTGSYSFSFKVTFSSGSTSGRAWSSNASNTFYRLNEYNPENPSAGGIDYSKVTIGESYTYKNDNYTETAGEGYWEDSKGTRYTTEELKSVGVYIPSQEVRYARNPIQYLHNGLRISIGGTNPEVNGTAKANVQLWKTPSDYKTEDDSLGKLTYAQSLIIQSASRSKDAVNFTFKYSSAGQGDLICDLNCSAAGLGMDQLSLATQESANKAVDRLDESLNKISMVRACFGAIHNRLSAKIDNVTNTGQNLTASESQIRDADMPSAVSEFSREQLVTQAASAMLAQANMSPRSVLQLLNT